MKLKTTTTRITGNETTRRVAGGNFNSSDLIGNGTRDEMKTPHHKSDFETYRNILVEIKMQISSADGSNKYETWRIANFSSWDAQIALFIDF